MEVSVYITSYNQRKLLREAIESVLAQTRRPDEIVIADDCSEDGSQELIQSYASEYPGLIRPVLQDRNVGIPKNRNDACRVTTGDYVTHLDGDDRFYPEKIEADLNTLEKNPEADIACANVAYIDLQGNEVDTWCESQSNVPTGDVSTEVLARDFPKKTVFRNEMVRREIMEELSFYDTDLSIYEDWEFRIRLSQYVKVAYSHKITSAYRQNPRGISRSHVGRHLDASIRVYRKHRSKIESMAPEQRRHVNQSIRPWIGQFAWRAFREALERRDRQTAWAYLLDAIKFAPQFADVRGIAQFFLPQALVDAIRTFRR